MQYNEDCGLQHLVEYFLSSVKINLLAFIPSSDYLITIDDCNDLFLIHKRLHNNEDIKKLILLSRKCINLSAVKVNECIHIMALCALLPQTDENWSPKDLCSSLLYIVVTLDSNYSYKITNLTLNDSYLSLCFKEIDSNEHALGVRFIGNEIRLIQIHRNANDEIELKYQRNIKTAHECDEIKICQNAESILSFGPDGLLVLWNNHSMEVLKESFVFHRYSNGINYAAIDPTLR